MDYMSLFVPTMAFAGAVIAGLAFRSIRRDRDRSVPTSDRAPAPTLTTSCRYCELPAEHQVPTIKHARPLADALLRRLGIVPVVRFQLHVYRGIEHPFDLCELHYYRARSLLEVEVGEVPSGYARWVDSTTKSLVEFQARGLAAKLEADELAASKRPRRVKDADATGSVVSLTRRVNANGNGA